MASSRKLRRKKELSERKRLKKEMKQSVQRLSDAADSLPSRCQTCGKDFDRKDQTVWSEWIVDVTDEGTVSLTCIKCIPDSKLKTSEVDL